MPQSPPGANSFAGPGILPESFGAAGNANFFNPANRRWYSDESLTAAAVDDTAALQHAIDVANASGVPVLLSNRYLVVGTLHLGRATVRGAFSGQMNRPDGPALCASHFEVDGVTPITSSRQTDNTWSNPVLFCDNSGDFIGGGEVHGFAILGNSQNRADHHYRCPRTAIQALAWMNGPCSNILVHGFSRPGFSMVGNVQDRDLPGWWFDNVGSNDGTTYAAAIETRVNHPSDHPQGDVRAPNALHFSGLRMNACPAFIDIDQGVVNTGEIDFRGAKFEVRRWQTVEEPMIRINRGAGAIYFGAGTHFTVPTCRNAAGSPVAFTDVGNYQTLFDRCTWRGNHEGNILFLRSTGENITVTGQIKDASYRLPSIQVEAGLIDLTLLQRMSDAGGVRYGIAIGQGGHVARLDVRAYRPAAADVTSGALIVLPPASSGEGGGPVIDQIAVFDDGSGRRQVNLYYGETVGPPPPIVQATIGRIVPPRPVELRSAPEGNRIDLRKLGSRHVRLSYAGARVEEIVGAAAGETITLEATAQPFILGANDRLQTSSGEDRAVDAGQLTVLRIGSDGRALETG